ncbi:MAG: DUF1572 family protein [Flavobacteriaceae bacterium]
MSFRENYIENIQFEFNRYKLIGDKTFAQLSDEDVLWTYSETSNSIAIIVKHMAGNMRSRWTNFLLEDGEKPWRNREMEFEKPNTSKAEMIIAWENGWKCLFDALDDIDHLNFDTKIKIRNEEHSIIEAINRQLAHYCSHVGQIVFMGKMIKGADWISLSIPKGESDLFNKKMFG